MDETTLITQARRGEQHAFRLLLERYQRPLFQFLGAYGLPPASVEDIAQESFLRAHRNLARYDAAKGASFATWLFTIAKRLAFDELRRSGRQAPLETTETVTDHQPGACESLQARQQREQVRQALRQLPEPYRSAIALAYIQELSLEQIAAIEQCAVGTVKSRIFRAKEQLRSLLLDAQGTPHE
jgi:RNA polymerase sigma-70 factor (ECF subfamily)